MSASVSRQNLARAGRDVVDHAIISFHLLWSPCRSWLLFVITCGYVGGPIFGRGALEMGRGWSSRNALPTCYHAKFGRYTSTEIRQKTFAPCVPPFRITQGRRNRQTSMSYWWLTIIYIVTIIGLTVGLSRTVSEIKAISIEIRKFSLLPCT